MLRTKYLWIIHLAVALIAFVVCLSTVAQPFLTAILGIQWLVATFTVSIVLGLMTLVPGPPMTNAVSQIGVWVLALALAGPTELWLEVAIDPLLGIGAASFNWAFYLWCTPLLGLYLIGTAVYQIIRTYQHRAERLDHPVEHR